MCSDLTEEKLKKLEKELDDINLLIGELEIRVLKLKKKKKSIKFEKKRVSTHLNDLERKDKYKSIKNIKKGDVFKFKAGDEFKFGNNHFHNSEGVIFTVKIEKETKTQYTLNVTADQFISYTNYSKQIYNGVNKKFKFNIKKVNFKDILIKYDESFKRSEKLNNLLNN